MKKLILLYLVLNYLSISSEAQYGAITAQTGYSAFGLNYIESDNKFNGLFELDGSRRDFGLKYSYPLLIRKEFNIPIIELSLGIVWNNQHDDIFKYAKRDIPIEVKGQWGRKLKVQIGVGMVWSKVTSEGNLSEFKGYREAGLDKQRYLTCGAGFSYEFLPNHELGAYGIWRRSQAKLFTVTLENHPNQNSLRTRNEFYEYSAGVIIYYKFTLSEIFSKADSDQ